jgi:hypothetical protein
MLGMKYYSINNRSKVCPNRINPEVSLFPKLPEIKMI